MSMYKVGPHISTKWLRSKIGSQVKNAGKELRILDTSYVHDRGVDPFKEFYMQGHIPQALSFNLHQCVDSTKLIPRNLPDVKCFTEYVRSLGIHRDTHIVAYDRFGPLSLYRTWWTFKLYGHHNISMLDGGLKKWQADGYELTKEVPEVEKSTDFEVKFDNRIIRDYNAMKENLKTQEAQVVDARKYEDEANDGGHIPGSKFVIFQDLFQEDGTLKSQEKLKQLFDQAGVDLQKPMIATCLLGLRACALSAVAGMLGQANVPVYYGSWTEWSQLASDDLKAKLQRQKS